MISGRWSVGSAQLQIVCTPAAVEPLDCHSLVKPASADRQLTTGHPPPTTGF